MVPLTRSHFTSLYHLLQVPNSCGRCLPTLRNDAGEQTAHPCPEHGIHFVETLASLNPIAQATWRDLSQ